MSNDAGFVKLYRSLLGHPAFRNDAEAMAFAWMVIRASWKPSRVRYKDRAINLQRGQLAMSVRDMAAAMDRDKAWIERLWKRLKAETMIETVTEAGVSVVTICNYSIFQGERDASETDRETMDETGARQAQDTEQRREEDKNTSEDKSSSVVDIARARKPDPFPRPNFADAQVWADFLTNRKAKRQKNTATAYAAFLRSIATEQDDNWPPGRLLEHAAAKGWGSIHNPDKDDRNELPRRTSIRPAQQKSSRAARLFETMRVAEAQRGDADDYSPTGRSLSAERWNQ